MMSPLEYIPEYQPSQSPLDDPTMKLSRANVVLARNDNSGKVYRVYCDGVFDLFHLAHMRMFEQAKTALGPASKVHLIAGVCSDELVHRYKGKTVLPHTVRCESARHCRWVDQVLPDAPWVLTDEFLKLHEIDFVAHDAIPYTDSSGHSSDSSDVYAHIKARGMFLETQRTSGISTSDIIVQILRDYDDYVIRNLQRGYTYEQMNVDGLWTLRQQLSQRNRAVKGAMERVSERGKNAELALVAFIKEFNPRWTSSNPSFESNDVSENSNQISSINQADVHPTFESPVDPVAPVAYFQRLSHDLPGLTFGVLQHSIGWLYAIGELGLTILSYANPLSYLRPPNVKEHNS